MSVVKNLIFGVIILILLNFQNGLYAMEEDNLTAEKNKENFTFENKFRRTRWMDEEEDKELLRKSILRSQKILLESANEAVLLTKRHLKQRVVQWKVLPSHDQVRKFYEQSKLESIIQSNQRIEVEKLIEKLRSREAKLKQEKNRQVKKEDLKKLSLKELGQLDQELNDRLNQDRRKYINRPIVYYEQNEIISNNATEVNPTQEIREMPDNLIKAEQTSTQDVVNKTSINVIQVIRKKLLDLGASLKNWRNVIYIRKFNNAVRNKNALYENDPDEPKRLDIKIFFSEVSSMKQMKFKKYFLKNEQLIFQKIANIEE